MVNDDLIRDDSYGRSLEKFYGKLQKLFDFHTGTLPAIFFVPDRETFDTLVARQSSDWEIGQAFDDRIYFLALEAIRATESHKNYSADDLSLAIKHEAAHIYFNRLTDKKDDRKMPRWLSEGLAVYWSGQQKEKGRVSGFAHLNDEGRESMKYLYGEGGTAVEILVEKLGVQRLKELLRSLVNEKDTSHFSDIFEGVYGFRPVGEEFERLIYNG